MRAAKGITIRRNTQNVINAVKGIFIMSKWNKCALIDCQWLQGTLDGLVCMNFGNEKCPLEEIKNEN